MSKGSAIVSILIAFVAGMATGYMFLQSHNPDETEGMIEPPAGEGDGNTVGAGQGEGAGDRLRAEVPPNAPQRGPDDALVTIVMFSDYQCPFCKRAEPTISRILNEHRNDVRVVWRDNPLPF